MRLLAFVLVFCTFLTGFQVAEAQSAGEVEIARAKYRGGGDWYNDPSALTNLLSFAKSNFPLHISGSYSDVSLGSTDLHNYPFVFLTGHGNITLNAAEARNVREYLQNGGFLYIDDDYGLDQYIRPAMNDVFPDEEFVEIPFSHPIYDQAYEFPNGVPKIHEHDGKPPQGFGIFYEGRLVVFYTYESNLGDGWADAEIHNTPQNLRQQAFRMGTNILIYALTGSDQVTASN
ncbi:DUF4159 domain-containing protein [Gracilimonas mengyeensis]|uniref:DUF4159 domain-containing protein n=1 Tax=Gracilimonas mengyeensis TaxID=1302730 RepID=A0A521FN97_9BACT|nr:DUF4159 domain-containing protein [Gracilimonas mengyeensis]SMO96931.1 protein of unknown function [Gracilimonas mengyeensis]